MNSGGSEEACETVSEQILENVQKVFVAGGALLSVFVCRAFVELEVATQQAFVLG